MDIMPDVPSEAKYITTKEECTEAEISLNLFQYLSSDDFDVKNLCRICMTVNKAEMYSVSHTKDGDRLPELFSSLTNIHVSIGLPGE